MNTAIRSKTLQDVFFVQPNGRALTDPEPRRSGHNSLHSNLSDNTFIRGSGPLSSVLNHARDCEISRLASHLTIVSWRLTQFRASRDSELYQQASRELADRTGIQESMDFVGHLRKHPRFEEYWLNGLRFIGGDLAIGEQSVADAPRERVKTCTSIATERQIAAYWLHVDDEVYSHVSPATFLSAC